jgi:hypothetical protein
MNRYLIKSALSAVVACWALCPIAPAGAQVRSGNQGETYASIATLPDWSGVWAIPFDAFIADASRKMNPNEPSAPQWTPDYAARMQAAINLFMGKDPAIPLPPFNAESCAPHGMPSVMGYAFAIEFLFTPGRVTILLEQDSTIRRVYTDRRTHDTDPDLSYAGESIGHWEGETLVIHTTAITPKSELLAPLKASGHTEVTERVHLRDKNHLQIDTVVEDPIALKAPWRYSLVYERSDSGFFERVCLDNNRDVNGGEPNLTPPNK